MIRPTVTAMLLAFGLSGAACSQPATAPPAGGGTDAGPVMPKVNRVILAVAPPARESNEMRHLTGPTSWQLRPMYESLIGIDPKDAKLVPQLATEWKVEPDGRSVRFQLRKGVPYHQNFGEVQAKDWLVTWKEIQKEDSLTGTRPYWMRNLKEIEVVNDHELIFRLNGPNGHFFESASEARGNMEPMSTAHYEKIGPPTMQTGPVVGTGPYQYKSREQGVNLVYEKVPYKHWRGDAAFPEFEFKWMREASTRLAGLIAGEIHLADLPEDLKPQALAQGMKVATGKVPALRTFLTYQCCYFNDINDHSKGLKHPDAPLLNVKLREALNKATDRDALNKAFFGGKGQVLVNADWHPTREGWNPEWERRFKDMYGYDQAAARKLLEEAGYGPGKPYTVTVDFQPVSGYSGAEDMLEAIAGMWRQVGVDVRLQKTDPAEWANQTREFKHNNHITVTATNATQWTGATVYATSLGPRSGYEDSKTDLLKRELLNTMDPQKQAELWRRTGDAQFDAFVQLPLFWLPVEAVFNPKIVADWDFPGSLSGSWSHVQQIVPAR